MITKNLLNIGFFLLFSSLLIAQSDYRITQEFKSRHRSFEIAIEYAKTIEELSKIKKEINEFRNDFKGNKELLNRALYPSNFESSFSTLDKKIEYTNKKLSEISELQTKVVRIESDYAKISDEVKKLSSEVNSLKNTNARLMTELKAFQSGYGGSKNEIDSLRNLVTQLKQGISRRDTLIQEIMDNIFMTAEHKLESLDDAEKKNIITKIQSTSLIDNIRNLISDNIEFLNASIFTSEDLTALKSEYKDFDQRWNHFGPKLFDIYSTDEKNKDKLNEIDTLISNWNSSLDFSVWKSINDIFKSHTIELNAFSNGAEFEQSAIDYINNQIDSGTNSGVQEDQTYVYFADRVWNEKIKANWIPLLISENLFTTDQITRIDNKLVEWKESTGGSKSYFIYGIIILLAIIIVISMYFIKKKNKKVDENIIESRVENKSFEIDDDDEFIDDKKE
ncbi:MAG: hypothetical protein H6609_17665 [Ignavibacteriales bacterium]|nr:hypothetical protein [Ignavibacteriales bacterium]